MFQNILFTKINIPHLQPGMVHRTRLIEILNDGLKGKFTLVSAPAGFGKTTLVSEWVATIGSSTAWISLDGEHNDLNRFLLYLIAAIQKKNPAVGKGALEFLESPYDVQAEGVLTTLLNDIANQVPQMTLVLDDYHMIENGQVNDTVAFLIGNMPPQMHVCILSRTVPSIPLARFRAKRQLVELSSDVLRFTVRESEEFFKRTMNLDLSAENVELLNNRTEGWVVGLQLAALSLKNHDNITELIRNFGGSHQYIFDYFIEEVLSCQPAYMIQFLEKTSILEKMCAPLCDAVIADTSISAQEMLETIERANLFITSLDNERKWYRYNNLFRDLLLKRLQINCTGPSAEKARPARLHQNACAWYAANGFASDAFRHAVAAGDFEAAAKMAEKSWPEMETTFQYSAFIGQMKMLPVEVINRHPVLCAGYAWSLLFMGKLEDAGQWIELTENCLSDVRKNSHPDEHDIPDSARLEELEYSTSLARIYKSLSEGNPPEASSIVEKILQASATGNNGQYSIFVTYASMIDSWRAGNLPCALQFVDCLIETLKKSGDRKMFYNMIAFKGYILEVSGELNRALDLYLNALDDAQPQSNFSPATSLISLKVGVVLFEQGELERARHYMRQSDHGERMSELVNRQYYQYIARSQQMEFRNDIAGALKNLHDAQRCQIRSPIPEIAPLAAQIARLRIRQGNLPKVKDWIDRQKLCADDEPVFMREYEHITLARYLIAHFRHTNDYSDLDAADALLERLQGAAKEGGRGSRVLELLILQAQSMEARNNLSGALEKLEQALTVAQPQQYVRIFINEGASMAGLLSKAKARGMKSDHLTTLLAFFEECIPDNQPDNPLQHSPLSTKKDNLLSDRELEVLKLVEKGFSNQKIGEKLFISLSTVKGHNLKIFGKLNAGNRTEALAIAKDLKLL